MSWKEKFKKYKEDKSKELEEYREKKRRELEFELDRRARKKTETKEKKRLKRKEAIEKFKRDIPKYKKQAKVGGARYVRAVGNFQGGRAKQIYSGQTRRVLTPLKKKKSKKKVVRYVQVQPKRKVKRRIRVRVRRQPQRFDPIGRSNYFGGF